MNDNIMLIIFIGIALFIFMVSKYRKDNLKYTFDGDNLIKPTYGNEFYNYWSRLNKEEGKEDDVIEGFQIETHQECPVKEGEETNITSCIHYPNKDIDVKDCTFDYGFIVSVSDFESLNEIQRSLNNDNQIYDIKSEEDTYYLTKHGNNIQELLPCNISNVDRIKRNAGTQLP